MTIWYATCPECYRFNAMPAAERPVSSVCRHEWENPDDLNLPYGELHWHVWTYDKFAEEIEPDEDTDRIAWHAAPSLPEWPDASIRVWKEPVSMVRQRRYTLEQPCMFSHFTLGKLQGCQHERLLNLPVCRHHAAMLAFPRLVAYLDTRRTYEDRRDLRASSVAFREYAQDIQAILEG